MVFESPGTQQMSHQIDVSQNGGTTQNDWFSKIPKKNG
jgi:hypothetical protein